MVESHSDMRVSMRVSMTVSSGLHDFCCPWICDGKCTQTAVSESSHGASGEWMRRNNMHAGWKSVELGSADWTGVAFVLGRVGNFSQSESRNLSESARFRLCNIHGSWLMAHGGRGTDW